MKHNVKRAWVSWLGLLWFASGATAFAADVRLAVVSEAADVAAAGDVLTAALSKQPGVAVLERSEIEKVYREQALGGGARDFVKLGQILGADGVLLLELSQSDERRILAARLVAVKPGVVLVNREDAFPIEAPGEWAALAVRQFTPFLPKLVVLTKEAVPISILNLRASASSAEAVAVERELTLLLHDRLSREKEIFVLERRRLERLAGEKELNGARESPFWSGSYLLEGVINPRGFSKDSVTVSARLVPPDKKGPVEIEVSGARTNLPALISNLTTRVLTALKRGAPKNEWNPSVEADQYFDEAKWAFLWGMMREAQASSDASWALGKNTAEVALLRIRAWRETGANQDICNYERESGRVAFGRPFNPNHFDSRRISSFSSPPDSERFGDLLIALELYERSFRMVVAPAPKLDKAWFELGQTLLGDVTSWLRQYYFTIESRSGQEERIASAKSAARRILAELTAHPDGANVDTNRTLVITKTRFAAFWFDAPEQCVAAYREVLQAGDWPRVRSRFLKIAGFKREADTFTLVGGVTGNLDVVNPALTGWKWEDRKRCRTVWDRFMDEMRSSTNPLVSLEARYIQCSAAWSGEEFERALRELLALVWQHHEAIYAAHLEVAWLQDLRSLVNTRNEFLDAARRNRIKEEVWDGFERQIAGLIQSAEERGKFESVKQYFKTQRTFDFFSFTPMWRRDYSAEQARELLPLLKAYKDRVSSPSPGPQSQVNHWTGQLEAKLNRVLTPPATNAPTTTALQTPERDRLDQGDGPRSMDFTNLLRVTRFWSLRHRESDNPTRPRSPVIDVCFRDGQLWTQYFEDELFDGGRRAERWGVCRIEPETFKTEYIPFDAYNMPYPRSDWGGLGDRSFDVFRGALYVSTGSGIKRYSLVDQKWEDVPVPVPGKARLQRLGERLFITTAESILELNADGSGGQILASTRRRPVQTILDALGGLGIPPVFMGDHGDLVTFVGGKVYSRPANSNDWGVAATLPGGPAFKSIVADDGMVVRVSPGAEGQLFGMFAGRPSFELLFEQLPRRSPMDFRPKPSSQPTVQPKWPVPQGVRLINSPLCLDGKRLWVFVGEVRFESKAGHAALKEVNGRQGLLYLFEPDEQAPLGIPLGLDFPEDLISGLALNSLVSSGALEGLLLLRSTPKGLVLARAEVPGFWFIPRADLERQIAELSRVRRAETSAGKSPPASSQP